MKTSPAPRATWMTCLLTLLAVIATIAFCLLLGGQWFAAVMSVLPSEDQKGIRLPSERFLGIPTVREILGFLIYGVAILPGLAVYFAGQWLCIRCGIRLWVTDDNAT